jgi:hypothetical protein
MARADNEGYWVLGENGQVYSFGDAFPSQSGPGSLKTQGVGIAASSDGKGYWTTDNLGDVSAIGDATRLLFPDPPFNLKAPIVGITGDPVGDGYWLVASDGGIFTYANDNQGAQFYGSTGALHLNKPIVGMLATADGRGYWLVASDGGVFSFGDARFYGSTGAIHLNKPIVGMTRTADGGGYWLVASDGGVFSFGDAAFEGSTGSLKLASPIVGIAAITPSISDPTFTMAATPDGKGYWLAASDGTVTSFGDAGNFGSQKPDDVVVDMKSSPDGKGYYLLDESGGLSNYGDAIDYGGISAGSRYVPPLARMSLTPDSKGYALIFQLNESLAGYGDVVPFGTSAPGPSQGSVPIIGFSLTASGAGSWVVYENGVIDATGDAVPYSTPATTHLITAANTTPDRKGLLLVDSTGRVFPYGDAKSYGSATASQLVGPDFVSDIVSTPDNGGYWLLTAAGNVLPFGDAKFYGSTDGSTAPTR